MYLRSAAGLTPTSLKHARQREGERNRESARAHILASKSIKASSNLAVKLVKKMTNIVVNQTKVIKVGN